ELMNFYYQARACLLTPRDDGMNLVSKEFVVAAAQSRDPGMLVLSQFAGSAIDLKAAIIINPYDVKAITEAIKTALEMDKEEKIKRLTKMAQVLSEKNVYQWATDFLKEAIDAEA
ncbi:MAG TPA: trehalose-6-phosphate synthase, partial [Patescibacteria group bacterium]|nr:trehalose-6-phosphate synthase [Patescibacteria group bacterium]